MGLEPEDLRARTAALAHQAGLSGTPTIHPLAGGANNRVYRVDGPGWRALLKAYFQHPDDPRDRLGAEWSFARFAWDVGLRCLAQPLAQDPQAHLGLYAFLDGRPFAPGDVSAAHVDAAITFVEALNRHRAAPGAASLPLASEACFTLAGHLERVGRRVADLARIDSHAPVDAQALAFVRDELAPAWERATLRMRADAARLGLELHAEAERCLSPSDFGFHNALVLADGTVAFVDFEYAGWDDPARLVGDFFCQPAVPVPTEYLRRFTVGVVAPPSRARVAVLLPLYRLKWCCILLNEFLPVARVRRGFSGDAAVGEERKRAQLAKAREALARALAISEDHDAP